MSYLLDTCILSKLRKIQKKPDKLLQEWIIKHSESAFYLSVLTIGEIQQGIDKLNPKNNDDLQKKLILDDWLNNDLIPRFKDRILSIDLSVIRRWGKISGEAQRNGFMIPVVDGLIAATASAYDLTLVTENVQDFMHTGVHIFNPWKN